MRKNNNHIWLTALLIVLISSCGSHRTVEKSESTDSLYSRHIEKTNVWYDVSRVDTFMRDRYVFVTLNDKGDTIKEKQIVYIKDKSAVSEKRDEVSEKADTTTSEKTRTVIKEKRFEPNRVQRFFLTTWVYLAAFSSICLIILLFRFCKRFRA